ncbi:MAG: carbon-nitrogen hydrolase family protein [Spirochaetales bacterium]|uniref:Carbon-nitrogen hydrolase family protein n=1 Tax=Candidatus Thalassospirochaeta sargassi TaxID=3119039 RepID=A0AAJ1IIQ2_9SPIO|nr:carbon-nitrogen hydrolase family protein [Spirochaetales bacterium]
MNKFNIALIQTEVTESKEQNLNNAEKLIRDAADLGADLAVLPEMFICPYDNKRFPEFAEFENGASEERLSRLAGETGLCLIAGTIPEKDESGRIYNTSYSFASDGKKIGKHRKIHLFDIDIEGGISFKESDALSPGDKATVIETPWGKVGVAICFDIRFAELFRTMAFEGAHTIVVPAAFNMTTGPAHWELSFRMRAVDNQLYMAGCAPARDKRAGYISYANSILTDPWGRILDRLGTEQSILIHEIDPQYAADIRQQLPILSGVKKDGYRF